MTEREIIKSLYDYLTNLTVDKEWGDIKKSDVEKYLRTIIMENKKDKLNPIVRKYFYTFDTDSKWYTLIIEQVEHFGEGDDIENEWTIPELAEQQFMNLLKMFESMDETDDYVCNFKSNVELK